jgi:uncharacterized protein (TIGR00251 family)
MNQVFSEREGKIRIRVKVRTRAKQSSVMKAVEGELIVRLKAAPVKGRANAELLTLLSKTLDLPKSQIQIVSGRHSRHKAVSVPLEAGSKLRMLDTSE